jgi:hypothetical protein
MILMMGGTYHQQPRYVRAKRAHGLFDASVGVSASLAPSCRQSGHVVTRRTLQPITYSAPIAFNHITYLLSSGSFSISHPVFHPTLLRWHKRI